MVVLTRSTFLVLVLFSVGCQTIGAGRADSPFPVAVGDSEGNPSEEALPELTVMLANDELSAQKVREITNTALTAQGDLSQPWSGAWGNWIETARAHGALSEAKFKRYAKQSASEWSFRANRAMGNSGGPGLSFSLNHLGGRVASAYSEHGLEISHEIIELRVEGINILNPRGNHGYWGFTATTGHGSGWFRTPDEIPGMERLKSGTYEATLILEEEIYATQQPERILKRNRIELKDDFEYYRNLHYPETINGAKAQ